MKYSIILLFIALLSNAQIKKEQLDLMPWPQTINLTNSTFRLSKNFKVNITGNPNSRIFIGATHFLRRLDGRTGLFFDQGFVTKLNEFPQAQLQINCLQSGIIALHENESYQLDITPNKITINAHSDLGALHGLETLLQVLQNDSKSHNFPTLKINDSPRFTWRGLMIDAARHFQPVDVIKRNLDAMAAVKLNVFHWHLTDDQGWRVQIKKHPKLTELGSDGLYYTQEEIRSVVKYADERGILVVPEIDVPGHASAILTAYPEIGSAKNSAATYNIERNAGIFNPTLDPSNPKTYQLLSEIFDEVCPLFPSAYFHIGGDENEGKEWDANPKIQEFKKRNKLVTNHDLQTFFTMKLVPMLKKYNKQLMGWEEIMTKDMSKNAVIHSWKGPNEGLPAGQSVANAAKNGYQTVLSNGYYLDLMQSVNDHYLNDPIPKNTTLTMEEKAKILGGEATMWTELITPVTIDSRIWPRTAAIAERLWSSQSVVDLSSMHKRIKNVSFRLEELGITHIKNKAMILRNISNNQDIKTLEEFSAICEPLKIYSRNAGGTEYQMYSPLTLFADACSADAAAVLDFDTAVDRFLKDNSYDNQLLVTHYLNKWMVINADLINLSLQAPLINPILPLSKSLNDLSKQLLLKIKDKQVDNSSVLRELLEQCNSKNHADVELAVYKSVQKLVDNYKI